jgi:hypothetical protein
MKHPQHLGGAITATIEFVRLADMCGVTGMESLMAEHIQAVVMADPVPQSLMGRRPDTNTHCLISQHIISAASLPAGHPVRVLLAAATVEGYLRCDNYKLSKEAKKLTTFLLIFLRW